ncbi:unnamed protein product [Owenia fusiformis]|uniref:Uncharacterized protein n=1 Tax=Owenia fusiformis TaxID=6347 RepID=A0A8J1UGR8_OWEFU|nr:unnamed protein product [Owenia fusiformis]
MVKVELFFLLASLVGTGTGMTVTDLDKVDGHISEKDGVLQEREEPIIIFNKATELFFHSENCPPGYYMGVMRNDVCYLIGLTELTHREASEFCRETQGGLVVIEDAYDHAYLVGHIVMQPELRAQSASSTLYWTSGTNLVDEVWTWSTTGQYMNFTKFSEQTNPDVSGYMGLFDDRQGSPSSYYDWWVYPAYGAPQKGRFICQHKIKHDDCDV